VDFVAAQFVAAGFTAIHTEATHFAPALPAVLAHRSMMVCNHTSSKVCMPVPSAALTMEECREASPLAGNRASAGDSTAVEAFTEEEATEVVVAGSSIKSVPTKLMTRRRTYAHEIYDGPNN
jgi:hypothetical protein